MESTYIDVTELDDIFGEMDEQETLETLVSLQGDFSLKFSELSACLTNNDIDTFVLKAHSLKSNCGYLQANQLSKCALNLEQTQSFIDSAFLSNWQDFEQTYTATMAEITTTINDLTQ